MENDDLDLAIKGGGRKNNGFLRFIKAELWLLLADIPQDELTPMERDLFLLLDADHQIQEILDANGQFTSVGVDLLRAHDRPDPGRQEDDDPAIG